MKYWLLSVLLVVTACNQVKFLSPSPSAKEDPPAIHQGKEVAKVNDISIREGYLDLLSRLNPRVKAQLANPATRKQILDNLIDQELMYQASLKKGLDQRADVKEKMALYQRIIISQALLEDEIKAKAKAKYEETKDTDFTKIQFSQIQVNYGEAAVAPNKKTEGEAESKPATRTKEEALKMVEDLKAKLAAGEDFAKLAEASSDDKISKRRGGDMGMVSKADKRLARLGFEKLGEAAFSLKNGEVSNPIETERAIHIIKVTSDVTATPFEEAEKVLSFQIQREVKEQILADLKKNSKVVYVDMPAAPPAQPSEPAPTPNGGEGDGHDHGAQAPQAVAPEQAAPSQPMNPTPEPAAPQAAAPQAAPAPAATPTPPVQPPHEGAPH